MRIIKVVGVLTLSLLMVALVFKDIYKKIGFNYWGNLLLGLITVFFLIQVIYLLSYIFNIKQKGIVVEVIKIHDILNIEFHNKEIHLRRFFFRVKTEIGEDLILNGVYINEPNNTLTIVEDFFYKKKKFLTQ